MIKHRIGLGCDGDTALERSFEEVSFEIFNLPVKFYIYIYKKLILERVCDKFEEIKKKNLI